MPTAENMFYKTVEYNKWIDENWLTVGEAYFYKRDYFKDGIEIDSFIEKTLRDHIERFGKIETLRIDARLFNLVCVYSYPE